MGTYTTTLPAQRTPLIGRDRVRQPHPPAALRAPARVIDRSRRSRQDAYCDRSGGAGPGGLPGRCLLRRSHDGDRSRRGARRDGQRRPAIGPAGSSRPPKRLAAHLGLGHSLLVVDNCEHVVEGAAEVIDDLLSAAPDLRVLATSREPLQRTTVSTAWMCRHSTSTAPNPPGYVCSPSARWPPTTRRVIDDAELETVARDRPAPRRHPTGDRARRGAGAHVCPRADPRASRRPISVSQARRPARATAATHTRRRGRVVLRAPRPATSSVRSASSPSARDRSGSRPPPRCSVSTSSKPRIVSTHS